MAMGPLERFVAYAAAFEETYRDDDWTRLEPYFTEDAVYAVTGGPPLGGVWKGRSAVLDHLREILNQFDRRADQRILEPKGAPRVEGESVVVDWSVRYRLAGAPDLVVGGTERADFAGPRIARLEDVMEPGSGARIHEWMATHLA